MRPSPRQWPLLIALCGGYFLVLLDVTVVNVALPSIGSALHATAPELAWVVDAYAVPLAALLLAAGAIGDQLGHRRVVLVGFAGFGAASVLCALAPSIPLLVAGRAVQGGCAALMLPGTLALLTESAPDDRARARVVGLWAAVGGAALPAGPLLGGLLTAVAGWQAVFWLNVPVLGAAIVPVLRLRSGVGSGSLRRVDRSGALVLVVLLGAAVTAVVEVRSEPLVAGLAAVVSGLAAALFCWVEHRAGPARLLAVPPPARGRLAAACLVAGLMNLCTLGSLFLLTQLFQVVHHLSAPLTGLLLLPAMAPLALVGISAGRLTARIGAWRTAAIGLTVAAAGLAGLAVSVGRPHYPVLVCALLLWGTGLGVLTPAVVTAALRALPDAPGAAAGASNTARQTGGAIGVALFAAIAGDATAATFAPHTVWALAGSAVAFAVAAGCCRALTARPAPAQPRPPSSPGRRIRTSRRGR